MTKNEFLNYLANELILITEEERKDIIMEYGTYIEDKISSGCSEREAVAGFGDVHELAQDILRAYKINTDSVHSKMDRTLDKVYTRSESFLNKAGNLSMNDIFHLLFDAFVLLLILAFGKLIIVDFFLHIFLSLLFSLSGGYFYSIQTVIEILLAIVYFVIALFFFFSIMIRRLNRYKNKSSYRKVGVIEDIKSTWNQEAREFVPGMDKSNTMPPLPEEQKHLYHERVACPFIDEKTKNILIKVLLVLLSIPLIFAFIGFVVLLVMMIYVSLIKQASSIGLYLLVIGCIGGVVSILWLFVSLWPKGGSKDA